MKVIKWSWMLVFTTFPPLSFALRGREERYVEDQHIIDEYNESMTDSGFLPLILMVVIFCACYNVYNFLYDTLEENTFEGLKIGLILGLVTSGVPLLATMGLSELDLLPSSLSIGAWLVVMCISWLAITMWFGLKKCN
ncbi:hypothetical protein A1OO_03290 [Enterovibrio norvegicus FF-33]|uniref:hypothetical protein n=1 Tax=Enterovibrio norvegicus TaxID=188144 RepID=UPI00036A4418|nr:hypothetical protein [Enterovibrio norvegicus]OEE69819.1 hypothetical protein A1OO_03290 [Enterovibrio norvegicus FF-33]